MHCYSSRCRALAQVAVDLPAPIWSRRLVSGSQSLYGVVCRRSERRALVDDFDVSRLPGRPQCKGYHRHENIGDDINILNSICLAVEARICGASAMNSNCPRVCTICSTTEAALKSLHADFSFNL